MVYVIESGNYFKIGYTTQNMEARMKVYNTHNPDYSVVEYFELAGRDMEKFLHERFHSYHFKMEWFNKYVGWKEDVVSFARDWLEEHPKSSKYSPVKRVALYITLNSGTIKEVDVDNSRAQIDKLLRVFEDRTNRLSLLEGDVFFEERIEE